MAKITNIEVTIEIQQFLTLKLLRRIIPQKYTDCAFEIIHTKKCFFNPGGSREGFEEDAVTSVESSDQIGCKNDVIRGGRVSG